jgi:hypothetical protein
MGCLRKFYVHERAIMIQLFRMLSSGRKVFAYSKWIATHAKPLCGGASMELSRL